MFLIWLGVFSLKLLNTCDVYRDFVIHWSGDKYLSSSIIKILQLEIV